MNDNRNGVAGRYMILGFPRSGTTLLSRLLDAHPDISSPPETGMFSAAGRFLAEQSSVEGPPIGVLTGLGFAGLSAEEVMAPLRALLFDYHHRVSGGKPVWVEKTATDVFHIETLEQFVSGHMRFIYLTRHPLDVIASNLDLMTTMGAQLPELFAAARGVNGPVEGLARALADRTEALDRFAARQASDCFAMRYEDFLANPQAELARLFSFMGLSGNPDQVIADAFSASSRIGLGDFRIHETAGLRPMAKDSWRKRLPRAAAARAVPLLSGIMERHGYPVPKLPKPPAREDAIRQFTMAALMKRNTSSGPSAE